MLRGLAEDFPDLLVPLLGQRFSQHTLALLPHLFFGDAAHFGGESPQQPVLDVRVKVSLKFMPVGVLASDDEPVECPSLQSLLQKFGHVLEMVQNFVIHAAFGVAGIVTRKSVAAAATGKRPEKRLAVP